MRIARGDSAGSEFDGELNNFQTPELSSLARLVSIFFFAHSASLQASSDD
jgi:hypothetical protein